MSKLKYTTYVNLLKSNNIILYDHDYRISYNNIKTYYNKTDMKGGGNNSNNNMNELFNNMDNLIDVINLSLSVNPQNLYFLANN
jgi:hypothetical protein